MGGAYISEVADEAGPGHPLVPQMTGLLSSGLDSRFLGGTLGFSNFTQEFSRELVNNDRVWVKPSTVSENQIIKNVLRQRSQIQNGSPDQSNESVYGILVSWCHFLFGTTQTSSQKQSVGELRKKI